MFKLLYLRQTFTDYVSNQSTFFGMLTCQMLLQVMEGYLIRLLFLGFSYTNTGSFKPSIKYKHRAGFARLQINIFLVISVQ